MLWCEGFSLWWLLLLWSTGSKHAGSVVVARGLSSCGSWAQQLWLTGLVAPQHVGSSQTRAGTRVPCTDRQTVNHHATREAPAVLFKQTQQYFCDRRSTTVFNCHNHSPPSDFVGWTTSTRKIYASLVLINGTLS